ncbi:MAG: DUF4062 domain-containing protein [Acidimicrobiia bacterium]|nr:DUF4062 domain-containing protein [Acidimicrobiia bacterium]
MPVTKPEVIRTPDHRLRVFVSSTLQELTDERAAVRRAVERLDLTPVMFEAGARPHPPRELYRSYLEQSHVFVGLYWQRYGWAAPGDEVSGLEDEYRLSAGMPRLLYLKEPAPERDERLEALLDRIRDDDTSSYRRFGSVGELEALVASDLAVLLTERFEASVGAPHPRQGGAAGTSAEPAGRKLAAIVAADFAGSARTMRKDEIGTLTRIRSLMADLVAPIVERHRGRVIRSVGQGWMAEFASVTDAVLGALEVQQELAAREASTPKASRVALKVGVSLGEVIFEGDQAFGAGVNLATRLESAAAPGGVCVSDWVHEQIRTLSGLRIEAMNALSLESREMKVGAFMVYRRPVRPARSPATAPPPAATLGGASIAVLPFANLSGDPSQEYFVDGMVDDILTGLARFKSLAVVARQSSFVYKGRAADVREVGRELGVRYVLEGSVQKSHNRVRITGQLIDATTGAHVFADRFEGDLADVFDLQDHLTERVVGVLEPQIRRAEIDRARRARPESLSAYDLYLQAIPHVYAMRPADNTRGLELLDEAMRLDPTYIPAQAFAAWCLEQRLSRGWPTTQLDDAERAIALARSTIDADTGDANVIAITGFVLLKVGREYEPGLAALRDAVRLNPNNAFVLMNAGWAEVFAGSLGRAEELFERARSLSPRDPASFYVVTGLAMIDLLSRRFDDAIALASESVALYGDWDATWFVLGMAYAYGGRDDEARHAIDRVGQLLGGASVWRFAQSLPISDAERRARIDDGLRLAGVPEE